MLKTEVQVMHQHLRRLDPGAPHVYGHFTSQLNQPQSQQTNGASSGISLPPLNPPNGAGHHAVGGGHHSGQYGGAIERLPPAAAMQGVEYGYGR